MFRQSSGHGKQGICSVEIQRAPEWNRAGEQESRRAGIIGDDPWIWQSTRKLRI